MSERKLQKLREIMDEVGRMSQDNSQPGVRQMLAAAVREMQKALGIMESENSSKKRKLGFADQELLSRIFRLVILDSEEVELFVYLYCRSNQDVNFSELIEELEINSQTISIDPQLVQSAKELVLSNLLFELYTKIEDVDGISLEIDRSSKKVILEIDQLTLNNLHEDNRY